MVIAKKNVSLYCNDCGKIHVELRNRCIKCNGMIEVGYDNNSPDIFEDGTYFNKFWPVLPIEDPSNILFDTDLCSPTIQATNLQKIIGGPELWIKDETKLPTKTTKDRMSLIVFPFLKERGVKEFVMSSTGNSSTAIANVAKHYPDMTVHLFLGKNFAHRLYNISDNVIVHLVNNNFVETGKIARNFAQEHELHWEGGFFNPARREGLKTIIIEAFMDIGEAPSYYVQAVSSAMGIVGVNKAAKELEQFGLIKKGPKLVCVQQESCSPMVTAWKDNSQVITDKYIVKNPYGIAKAILRGDPTETYPIVANIVQKSSGDFMKVTDQEIYNAQSLLYKAENINACEAGAASLAGYIKFLNSTYEEIDGPVLINISGSL